MKLFCIFVVLIFVRVDAVSNSSILTNRTSILQQNFEISFLRQMINQETTIRLTLDQNVRNLMTDINILKQSLAASGTNISELQHTISSLQRENNELKSEFKANTTEMQHAIVSLQRKNNELKSEFRANTSDLQHTISTLQRENNELKNMQEMFELNSSIDNLKTETNVLKANVKYDGDSQVAKWNAFTGSEVPKPPAVPTENLSRKNSTTISQSSIYENNLGASLARDGIRNTSYDYCAVTDVKKGSAWMQIDLGKPYAINNVVLYGRTDKVNDTYTWKPYRLRQFKLDVSNSSMASDSNNGVNCYTDNTQAPAVPPIPLDVPCQQTARYIAIKSTYSPPEDWTNSGPMLEICEFEVYGSEPPKPPSPIENLSRKSSTTISQSSVYLNKYNASLANDGIVNTTLTYCAVTDVKQGSAWIQVDLGKPYKISNVKIYARKEKVNATYTWQPYRLRQFTLDVGNSSMTSDSSNWNNCYSDETVAPAVPSNILDIPCAETGRYVAIETMYAPPEDWTKSGPMLEICEFEVYGSEY